jgi:ankyrin repeat protein
MTEEKMEFHNLAQACNRFPMIADMIFKNLDDESLSTCKMASRNINTFVKDERFFWLRQIGRYNKHFQEFQMTWNKTLKQTPTFILMKIAKVINLGYVKKLDSDPEDMYHHFNWSPLHVAAGSGSLELCEYILEKTKNSIQPGRQDVTPMHLAALRGHLEIVKFLIENHFDKNAQDVKGNTPLHFAAMNGQVEVFKYLFDASYDKNPPNNSGETPLQMAVEYGHLGIYKVILKNELNKNLILNQHGTTALHLAAANGNLELVKYIVKNSIDPNPGSANGNTPFHEAVRYGRFKVCQFFLDTIVDKNPRDIAGITPFQLATNKEVKFRDVTTGATGAMSLKLLIAHYLDIFVGFENLSNSEQIELKSLDYWGKKLTNKKKREQETDVDNLLQSAPPAKKSKNE